MWCVSRLWVKFAYKPCLNVNPSILPSIHPFFHISIPPFIILSAVTNCDKLEQINWMNCSRNAKNRKNTFKFVYQFVYWVCLLDSIINHPFNINHPSSCPCRHCRPNWPISIVIKIIRVVMLDQMLDHPFHHPANTMMWWVVVYNIPCFMDMPCPNKSQSQLMWWRLCCLPIPRCVNVMLSYIMLCYVMFESRVESNRKNFKRLYSFSFNLIMQSHPFFCSSSFFNLYNLWINK